MTEEPCQCSDCQRFYKEHDRLIREFPTFNQQQELNWASIQSFRTLCNKVTDELHKQLSARKLNEESIEEVTQLVESLGGAIVHGPQKDEWAPGYYSVLFEDPCGTRLEVNYVPGKGNLDKEIELPLSEEVQRKLSTD